MFDSNNIISSRVIKMTRLGIGGVGGRVTVIARALLCTDGIYFTDSMEPYAFINPRDNFIYNKDQLRAKAKLLNKDHKIAWGK